MHSRTQFRFIAAATALIALAACKKDEYAKSDTAAGVRDTSSLATTTDSTHAAMSDSTKNASNGWSDANILAYTDAANTGEIQEGTLAEKKATNPAVKAFARQMIADHKALMASGKSLAAKLKATPDTTFGDARDLANHSRDEIKDLTGKAKGADWDKAFIDGEIDDHQKVLDKIQDASKNTTNTDLKAALEKAAGKVQEHLTKAQDIKAKLK
jgi:putative membrane protein